jgi:tRNA threonylcarbamoyladenosine biosynthesis protein TsaE
MIVASTSSADDTRALAASLAEIVRAGDVLLLGGDLGAGKTTFTQGLGRALGIREPITSPTFTLVRQYEGAAGQPALLHADVYRLEQLSQVLDLGLAELAEEGAVAVVEWGRMAAPAFGPNHLEVELSLADASDDARQLTFVGVGKAWAARAADLRRALGPWLATL